MNEVYAIRAMTIDNKWWDLDIGEILTNSCDNSDYTICRRIQGLSIVSCEPSTEVLTKIEDDKRIYKNVSYTYYIYSENIIAIKIMRENNA